MVRHVILITYKGRPHLNYTHINDKAPSGFTPRNQISMTKPPFVSAAQFAAAPMAVSPPLLPLSPPFLPVLGARQVPLPPPVQFAQHSICHCPSAKYGILQLVGLPALARALVAHSGPPSQNSLEPDPTCPWRHPVMPSPACPHRQITTAPPKHVHHQQPSGLLLQTSSLFPRSEPSRPRPFLPCGGARFQPPKPSGKTIPHP